jgi:Acyl-CoA dehydrogenase, N-terminal domain
MAEPQATPTTVSLEHKLDDARAAGADPEASRTHGCGAPVGAPGGGSPGRLGLFRALVPASAGGEEWDWSTWMRVVEELSTVDGAVGWLAGVGGSVNAIASGSPRTSDGPCFVQTPSASLLAQGHPGELHAPQTAGIWSQVGGSSAAGVLMPAGLKRALSLRARRHVLGG